MEQQISDIARYAKNLQIAIAQLLDTLDEDFRSEVDVMANDAQHIQHMSNLLRIKSEIKRIEKRHGHETGPVPAQTA